MQRFPCRQCRGCLNNKEFKKIATAGADTATAEVNLPKIRHCACTLVASSRRVKSDYVNRDACFARSVTGTSGLQYFASLTVFNGHLSILRECSLFMPKGRAGV